MEMLNFKSKLAISLVLSLVVLVSGVAALAQEETQTPSEKVGEGAREVIKGVLAEYEFGEETSDQAESLIDDGVPPGIVVSVVKSLETGHLSTDKLAGIFGDLRTNVIENDMPPGLVIKSIKTTYQLPEEVGEEGKGKLDGAGPPEGKGKNGENEAVSNKVQSEDGNSPEGENKGKPEDKGKPDEAGPPEGKGQNEESEKIANNGSAGKVGKPDKSGPPENKEDNGSIGTPEDKGRPDGAGPPEGKGQNGKSNGKKGGGSPEDSGKPDGVGPPESKKN